ncbi:hypothetical protein Cgig2_003189 [Carnegiea gigantea]|uniref:Uncharacterized protein n=1 Tax=Carnegiea gigantea TaxID=171969 RepID=A0A9Q1JMZ9_9CARY|nr:hypothetical protein Cgig2_003189 [Carnegiea gigantea]
MIPDLDEEEVEHIGENIFESRVLINMTSFLINVSDDFKDDKEGDDVEENQRNNTPLVGEPIRDTLTTTHTLAKDNEVYIKDACQIENTTVLTDKGGAAHTSRFPHLLNQLSSHSVSQQRRSAGGKENIQLNSLQGVNNCCITQIGKKHISVANRMGNSTIGMPQPLNLVNQGSPFFVRINITL